MRKSFILLAAIMIAAFMACSVHAKSNGSMGTDCASCHSDMVTEPPVTEPSVVEPPVTEPPVTDPPVTDPPITDPPVVDPPVVDPPVTDPPVVEPPVTEPPVVEPVAMQLQGVEITTIWDYNVVEGVADLSYVFFTVIETDNTVDFVEVITPSGTVLQLTQEASTQLDNVITRFTDEGGTFVWECEARFGDIKELAAYGKGKFTIATVTGDAVTDTVIKYDPAKAKIKRPKHKKNKTHDAVEDDDDIDDNEEDEVDDD